MKFNILIFMLLLVFNHATDNKIGMNLKVLNNRDLNGSEWMSYGLNRSLQASNKLKCISQCVHDSECGFGVFDAETNLCSLYHSFITASANLIYSKNKSIFHRTIKVSPNMNFAGTYSLKGDIVNKFLTTTTSQWFWAMDVLKNGNLVTGHLDSLIRVWNSTNNWKLIKVWQAHVGFIRAFTVLDNNDLVSGGDDGFIKVWNASNFALKQNISAHSNIVRKLGLFSNGYLVSGSFDKTFKIWNASNGTLIRIINAGHQIYSLIVLPNDDLATGGDNYVIKIWNYDDLSLKANLNGHTGRVFCIVYLRTGNLASGSDSTDKKILIWDMNTFTVKSTLTGHTLAIYSLIYLQNGNLASSSADYTIRIWNLTDLSCANILRNHTDSVIPLVEFKNGSLASGSSDRTVIIWS